MEPDSYMGPWGFGGWPLDKATRNAVSCLMHLHHECYFSYHTPQQPLLALHALARGSLSCHHGFNQQTCINTLLAAELSRDYNSSHPLAACMRHLCVATIVSKEVHEVVVQRRPDRWHPEYKR